MTLLLRLFAISALTVGTAAAQTAQTDQTPQTPPAAQAAQTPPTPLVPQEALQAMPPADILPPPSPEAIPAAQTPGEPLTPEQAAIVQRVNDYLNTLADLSGDFLQINPNGDQIGGKFYLSRPGKVRFDYSKPSPLQLISDGTTVAVRDRKANTQDLYYLAQTPLRVILAEKVDLLKDAKVLAVSQQMELTTVVIEEKSIVGNGRLSVVFEGPGFELRQWTVTDAQGLNTTVAIQNVEKSAAKLDPQLFKIRFDS